MLLTNDIFWNITLRPTWFKLYSLKCWEIRSMRGIWTYDFWKAYVLEWWCFEMLRTMNTVLNVCRFVFGNVLEMVWNFLMSSIRTNQNGLMGGRSFKTRFAGVWIWVYTYLPHGMGFGIWFEIVSSRIAICVCVYIGTTHHRKRCFVIVVNEFCIGFSSSTNDHMCLYLKQLLIIVCFNIHAKSINKHMRPRLLCYHNFVIKSQFGKYQIFNSMNIVLTNLQTTTHFRKTNDVHKTNF